MTEPSQSPATGLPPRPVFRDGISGIERFFLTDQRILEELQAVVSFYFPQPAEYYTGLAPDAYRKLVFAGQEELNRRDIGRRLARQKKDLICEVLQSSKPYVQTNTYLRATRPNISGLQENIGWHRESFYGPDLDQCINFWVPIANVSFENAVHYIPDSHLIPDSAIETVSEVDESVSRYSVGHKIGLLYGPKRIVAGADLSTTRELCVLPGEAAIFAGSLIHGAAENRSNLVRFSIDFRLIAEESMSTSKAHFASGKSYFEPL